ncbi:unnamed protein product (macronuclear) [Paramecium tetraurelia]|uniref:RING-type domain-containing protein n=1 Tax=Paramecium tetraurelia TaxID=5888 RepID=A0CTD2_PARTE|nr:uncharacterized protein GSPATT00010283001 [Paramecium tetraurelia]CAK74049.1 unnamed protein product [Paramecium tetraurelia]|eukprot:XP_001441446.1 hypothetical protein (macronuclear) [Paramecium tetraurelia strain d4-2]
MNQLIDDQQQRQCPKCQNFFVGKKILEHEKVCNQKQHGQSNNNQLESIIQNQQFLHNVRKCEYCDDDYPLEIYEQHIQQCDIRIQHQSLLQSVCPSQVFNSIDESDQQEEEGRQKLEILTKYFELMENYGEVLEKGEELVKISNFSIEPFAKTFDKKMCQSCKKNFILDEEILIMKCCFQIYHHICFSQIINQTNNCECGKQIIID